MNTSQLNGFACAVSGTPGTMWYQQQVGVYVHSHCAGKRDLGLSAGSGGIGNNSLMQKCPETCDYLVPPRVLLLARGNQGSSRALWNNSATNTFTDLL